MRQRWTSRLAALGIALAAGAPVQAKDEKPVRIGHFPNVTHAQAVIGRTTGLFEEKAGVGIEWKHFNAGPTAMEALLAGALDMTYVGPSPAINVYVRSQGKAIRVVGGAASGGALLIVRADAGIEKPEDFRKKKVAAPEIGNTQDVALRRWLKSCGLRPVQQGGDVDVLAIKNPEILALFQRKALDAAWVPEPWATRLLHEGGGKIFLDERELWPNGEFTTVVLVARTEYLEQHREVVDRIVQAHIELTDWMAQHPDEAKVKINEGLTAWMGQPLPDDVMNDAYARISFVVDPAADSMATSAAWAWELGYLPGSAAPDLAGLFELSPLNRLLAALGRSAIAGPAAAKP